MQPTSAKNFSTAIADQINLFTDTFKQQPTLEKPIGRMLSYVETIRAIHDLTLPLFQKIHNFVELAGFQRAELFQAWPKGLCENFVCVTIDKNKVTDVILAYTGRYYQNGGGKVYARETSHQALYRKAIEEFNYPGLMHNVTRITIESESGDPEFHFVKGVWVCFVEKEQARQMNYVDQTAKLVRMPVSQFLSMTNDDHSPYDHGFDRKWIAQFIRELGNNNYFNGDLRYSSRQISLRDKEQADKTRLWMRTAVVSIDEMNRFAAMMADFVEKLEQPQSKAEGLWKSDVNRKVIQDASQKMIDTVVERLLPKWMNGDKAVRQIKVQEAVGFLVNNQPLPTFLTISQFVLVQNEGLLCYRMESLTNMGYSRNLSTVRLW